MKIKHLLPMFLVAALLMAVPAASFGAVFISVTVAPPPIPVYVQPPCPAPGYLWTPGYWAWGPEGYYWVPGAWVPAPAPGLLWTPGYWGWDDGFYYWHPGYWGPQVGFYGGINYGFGYFGVGFVGGEWRGSRFYYNEAVVRVNRRAIRHVYRNRRFERYRRNERRVSYNGGPGGIARRADFREMRAERLRRYGATNYQQRQVNWARRNPGSWARNNRGRPSVAATSRFGDFSRRNRVGARSAGGRISNETLRATPRSMPERRRGGAFSRPGTSPRNVRPGQPNRRNAPQSGMRRRGEPARRTPNWNNQRPGAGRSQPGYNRSTPNYRRTEPGARQRTPNYSRPAPSQRYEAPGNQQPRYEQRTAPTQRRGSPGGSYSRPEGRRNSQPANRGFSRPEQRGYSQPQTRRQPQIRQRPQSRPRPEARPAPRSHERNRSSEKRQENRRERRDRR